MPVAGKERPVPSEPKAKVGIVACSGEELPEGTVTRLAALRVLHDLRPHETVTICLPLFLAGGENDRTFARVHPTITIDGCELRCAARATEMYSAKPAVSLVVTDFVDACGIARPEGRRQLNDAGRQAVEAAAAHVATLVDSLMGPAIDKIAGTEELADRPKPQEQSAPCAGTNSDDRVSQK
jgi:uncharacterized metal-binding protein